VAWTWRARRRTPAPGSTSRCCPAASRPPPPARGQQVADRLRHPGQPVACAEVRAARLIRVSA
jgi:hypothetical protein